MTFDEWFHKEYEPADLQIKQYAERKEGLHIPATCYLEDLKKAFEAGLHADVHTDNSKVIADLEEKLANADYIEKLEAQISVLLSCKNCPENKGGLICAKEYENKCLAQKIQFIKELQEENEELKEQNIKDCENFNKTMKEIKEQWNNEHYQLTKTKELLKWFVWYFREGSPNLVPYKHKVAEAEQFLNSEVEK